MTLSLVTWLAVSPAALPPGGLAAHRCLSVSSRTSGVGVVERYRRVLVPGSGYGGRRCFSTAPASSSDSPDDFMQGANRCAHGDACPIPAWCGSMLVVGLTGACWDDPSRGRTQEAPKICHCPSRGLEDGDDMSVLVFLWTLM